MALRILWLGLFLMGAPVARGAQVELQWSLCEPSATVFFKKASITTVSAQDREVFYRETKEFDLYRQGVLLRTRIENNKIKRTLKIKYSSWDSIPWALVDELGIECEKDRYSSAVHWGCSLKSRLESVSQKLSREERKFLGNLNAPDLQDWGPAKGSEWGFSAPAMPDLALESITGPHGYYSLELSTRVAVSDESLTFKQVQGWIQAHHILLCPMQQGKTGDLLKALMN